MRTALVAGRKLGLPSQSGWTQTREREASTHLADAVDANADAEAGGQHAEWVRRHPAAVPNTTHENETKQQSRPFKHFLKNQAGRGGAKHGYEQPATGSSDGCGGTDPTAPQVCVESDDAGTVPHSHRLVARHAAAARELPHLHHKVPRTAARQHVVACTTGGRRGLKRIRRRGSEGEDYTQRIGGRDIDAEDRRERIGRRGWDGEK
jgi:hypothetical protein